MSGTLNKKEIDQLMDLFDKIKLDLQDSSFPTRTNRLEAVENMKRVLKIHGYTVLNGPEICTPGQMTSEEKTRFLDARDQHLIRQNLNKATGGR
jgi:hypothetical protein